MPGYNGGMELDWSTILSTIYVVLDFVIKVLAVGFVPENRRPSSSTAWLLLILFLPIVGLPLFLLIGSPYISRRRHEIQARANESLDDGLAHLPTVPEGIEVPPGIATLVTLNRRLTALPGLTGTIEAIHHDYVGSFQAMAAAVDGARDYVHVEIYITAWDDTSDILLSAMSRAVERGVEVRLLFDHIGSMKYPGFRHLGRRLDAAGIAWRYMLPIQPLRGRWRRIDLRNHRKLVVVDGDVAFVGSQNLIDSSYLLRGNVRAGRHWYDAMAELTGDIVAEVEAVFAVDWYTETEERLDPDHYLHIEQQPARADIPGRRPTRPLPAAVRAVDRDGDREAHESREVQSPHAAHGSHGPQGADRSPASVEPREWLGSEVYHRSAPRGSTVASASGAGLERHRGGVIPGPHLAALQIVPSGPGFTTEPNLRLFTSLLHLAERRMTICSPYFVPDESLLAAVTTAAYRGVEVELFVNEQADQFMVGHAQASYYRALLDAGVVIRLYPAPAVLHTKFVVVDGIAGVFGSSNLDMRSFGLNYEISLFGYGGGFVRPLDELAHVYRERCRVLTPEEWSERSLLLRYVDNACRMTSALQ